MAHRTELFYGAYRNFSERVLTDIRKETFGDDIGQNSWTTVEEYDSLVDRLELSKHSRVLDIACGSGGAALRLVLRSGCTVTGFDLHESAIATARARINEAVQGRLRFEIVDATRPLPCEAGDFDAVICIDAMNHLLDRGAVLREWHRVLGAKGRILYTDPVVVTGPVTNDELATRGSIGEFLFVPPGWNERFLEGAGFHLLHTEDVTESMATIAGRWHKARQRRRADLFILEGEDRFDDIQRFFAIVDRLSRERRLSRFAYVAEK